MNTNTSETTKSFFDTMANTQKQMFDSWTSAAEILKKSVINNDATGKSADHFKNWYDSQMAFFNNPGAEFVKGAAAFNTNNPMDFYTNWYNTQMKMVEEWYAKSKEAGKTAMEQVKPFMPEEVKKNYDTAMNTFSTWSETMKKSYEDMASNMKNGLAREAFSGMFSNNDTYMKMYSLFSPLMSAIQNKSFTPDMMKNLVSPEAYKEMMDKMFNFAPAQIKDMYEKNIALFSGNFKKAMESGKSMFDSAKENSGNMFANTGNDFFTNLLSQHQSVSESLKNTMSPFLKLMTPGTERTQLENMAAISDKLALYSIKNAQMQYMTYTAGNKAVESLGEKIYKNMQDGVQYKNFMEIYNEWLSINDKVYVELFSTDEYSKLQAELSTISLTLKKEVNGQLEKMFVNLPLVPRSEMDELYKTVYELKKKINTLEKQLDGTVKETLNKIATEVDEKLKEVKVAAKSDDSKPAAKKSTGNKHN
jgi:polyhydroxyalkanoate synthesis regulator phasin